MTPPIQKNGTGSSAGGGSSAANKSAPHRPTESLLSTQSTTDALALAQGEGAPGKRRNHRGGKKKKKNRRQSFLPASGEEEGMRPNPSIAEPPASSTARPPFYRLGQSGNRNFSDTSLASEALLDHR